jgi:hypothetical protein
VRPYVDSHSEFLQITYIVAHRACATLQIPFLRAPNLFSGSHHGFPMLPHAILRAWFLPTEICTVDAVPREIDTAHERVGTNAQTAIRQASPVVVAPPLVAAVASTTVKSTVLVFARDSASAYSAYSGLNGIGIMYQNCDCPSGWDHVTRSEQFLDCRQL